MRAPISIIDHVALTTNDARQLVAFYVRVFGAQVAHEHEIDGVPSVFQLVLGGTMLNIHRAGHSETLVAAQPTPGAQDLCLRWDSPISDAVRWLDDAGVETIEGPVTRVGSSLLPGRSVYLRDPDGNLVELLSIDAPEDACPSNKVSSDLDDR